MRTYDEKEHKQAWAEAPDSGRTTIRFGWRLLRTRFFARLGAFYLRGGLALLVLVTAAIFLAAAFWEPDLLGSVRGGYRADVILLFGGGCSVLLAGLTVAYLLPRAVTAAYEEYALACFGQPRMAVSGAEATQAFLRLKGVYWWALLMRLCMALALGLCGWLASRLLGGLFPANRWSGAILWALGIVLFWQYRAPVMLSLAVAAREQAPGTQALRRGFRLFRRARYAASLSGLVSFCVAMLLITGIFALSMLLTRGHLLARYSIAAFLIALLTPPLRLLLAAFDTALYAQACRGCPGVARWHYSAKGARAKSVNTKGTNGDEHTGSN